jgi:hypothetical protein
VKEQPMREREDGAHAILRGNVQTLRDALRRLADEAAGRGDDEAGQARRFIERKIADISAGSSVDEMWVELELLYRKTTALVAETLLTEQRQAGMAFMSSAGMLLALLKPELSDEQREAQLMASIDRRLDELQSTASP